MELSSDHQNTVIDLASDLGQELLNAKKSIDDLFLTGDQCDCESLKKSIRKVSGLLREEIEKRIDE